jgi:hypothetical protein
MCCASSMTREPDLAMSPIFLANFRHAVSASYWIATGAPSQVAETHVHSASAADIVMMAGV